MSKKALGTFLTGAAIGAGVGILFAPKKGSETRRDLKNKTNEMVENIKNIDKEEVKEKLNKKLQELKKDLENLDKETALEIIKENGNKLVKKADELIKTAKRKSTPIIEKAALDVKEKTIVILKSALDRLEENNELEKPKLAKKKNTKTA